jgi:hypothetical protein
VHDTFTTGSTAGGAPPAGTVTFTVFQSNDCTGTVVAGPEQVNVVNGRSASSVTNLFPTADTSYSYRAHYNGDGTFPAQDASCEPFTVQGQKFAPALTPGIWKNHEAATTALLPITLGGYNVNTFSKAVAVFDAMKCSSPIDCLAGDELAAKLDLKSGSNPSISPTIAQADALLVAVSCNGPGKFTAPTARRKRPSRSSSRR